MRYFQNSEFKCPCCGEEHMDTNFLGLLDSARHIAGVPFKINSGYRCEKHNKEVGGVPESEHTTGEGADIAVTDSYHRFLILSSLLEVGFDRIGIGKDFIHVGYSIHLPSEVIWTYYGGE